MRSAGVLEPYKIGYAVYGGAEAYFSSAAVGAGYHIIHKPFEACTNKSFAALAVSLGRNYPQVRRLFKLFFDGDIVRGNDQDYIAFGGSLGIKNIRLQIREAYAVRNYGVS